MPDTGPGSGEIKIMVCFIIYLLYLKLYLKLYGFQNLVNKKMTWRLDQESREK